MFKNLLTRSATTTASRVSSSSSLTRKQWSCFSNIATTHQAFIQQQFLNSSKRQFNHSSSTTLSSSGTNNNNENNHPNNVDTNTTTTTTPKEEQVEIILTEKEKPIYELLTIVSNSYKIAHTIYDNIHPFATLLAQIEMMIKMLEELAQTQATFAGDNIDEIIHASKDLQISILCRRATCAMVCWRRAQTEEERNEYSQLMEQDYEKAYGIGMKNDELDFAYASFCKVIKQDLRKALHYVSKSIELNPKAPIKYLKRAELQFELFEHLKESGEIMRVEERSPSSDNSTTTTPPVINNNTSSEWTDEALDALNNCLIDCERYIEDTIQQAKEYNIKDYNLDYYVYGLRGRVFVESFLSDTILDAQTSKIFIANAERDFTLFIDHYKNEEENAQLDQIHPSIASELASALARRAMCRLHGSNSSIELVREDIERASKLLERIPTTAQPILGNTYSDISNFIEELKVLTQAKLIHNNATELGVKAAECQQTNPGLALEYLNEAITISEISPIPMLYIQRAFLNYETFRKQTQNGMEISNPQNRGVIDRVAQDCQVAITLDPSPKTTEARIVLAEYYSNITGEKKKAVEQYEVVLKYYMLESDEQVIKTVEETLEKLKKDLSTK